MRKFLVALLMLFVLAGCKTKVGLTVDEFLELSNKFELYQEEPGVLFNITDKEHIISEISVTDKNDIKAHFMVFDDSVSAIDFYNRAQADIESYIQEGTSITSNINGNYNKFVRFSSYWYSYHSLYYYLIRVDNTVLYGVAKQKDKFDSFIKYIGY